MEKTFGLDKFKSFQLWDEFMGYGISVGYMCFFKRAWRESFQL